MIYGLSCDGTNDSVIVFLPFESGVDPIIYNIETAKRAGKIIGQPQIGDWVGTDDKSGRQHRSNHGCRP